ncbi:MAG TPA: YhbY family RNA-binding protein [Holophagaceae bacterium]|nr:YhbY family RNA-binding protein [Holophagaceae bacterium]
MLNPKQRQFLKGQAHGLKAAMHIGKGGVTPALVAELDTMLDSLELVKVKLNGNAAEDEAGVVKALCAQIDGLQHVWTIGHTLLFFRASRTRPTRYALP